MISIIINLPILISWPNLFLYIPKDLQYFAIQQKY